MEPRQRLARVLPGLARLLDYQGSWLRPDLLAGVTVAAYLVPQCMAYAEVAGLAPVAGLWAILPPLLLYALLGSSPQLSVGPESTTAVMTAAAVGPLVAGDPLAYAGFCSLLALAVGLSVIDLFARLVRPHDAVMGIVPRLAGLHDVRDWEGARTIPGLVLFRFDAPLCFANAEHFRQRVLATIAAESQPVAWFVLNAEAIVEIDITAADVLEELQRELTVRGITFGLVRVKQDLYSQLERAGLVERIGPRLFFPTLPTAIAAFQARAIAAPLPSP